MWDAVTIDCDGYGVCAVHTRTVDCLYPPIGIGGGRELDVLEASSGSTGIGYVDYITGVDGG